jgi:hypothetical protein
MLERMYYRIKKLFHLLKYNNNFSFSSHQFEGGLGGGGDI